MAGGSKKENGEEEGPSLPPSCSSGDLGVISEYTRTHTQF